MPDALENLGTAELKALRLAATARTDLLTFMAYTWDQPSPFLAGRHTVAICDRLTKAVEDWRHGISTHLLIAVPFRHGKSEICSIALPAYFLGRCADMQPSVIMSGYGAALVAGFSRRAQRLMNSVRYQTIYPDVRPEGTASDWRVRGSHGTTTATGLGGAITGKGGHLIVLDDYCKSRAEAVSQTFRDKTWDAFRNDLMTRQNAPAHIVVVTATPWHIDDIRGRIIKSMANDPKFPRFEQMTFPARKPGPDGWDYLFPELHGREWYDAQRATLQKQAAALLDCDPIVEGGNRFDISKIVFHDSLDGWPSGREARAWDMASSSKDRDKDDPDRTWGIRGLSREIDMGAGVRKRDLWIKSMVACRAEAPERDALIRATARADGPGIIQHVEAFGAYKDAYTQLRAALPGHIVRPSRLPGDKSAKLAPLEPVVEGGDLHIYKPGCGQWLDTWLSELAAFPDGSHDDAPDATAVLFHTFDRGGSSVLV